MNLIVKAFIKHDEECLICILNHGETALQNLSKNSDKTLSPSIELLQSGYKSKPPNHSVSLCLIFIEGIKIDLLNTKR